MTQKLISIIIRTKNEERWISSCLRNVFKQKYKNIEVIIVDNESTDRTLTKVKDFPVKIVTIKNFLPGKAINNGIRASSGEYIVCLSGHCIPVSDLWLENLVKDLATPNVAGVYGRQEPLSFSSDLDKRDLLTVFGRDKKIQIKDSFFHNANSAFTREIWIKYPFDESLTNIEDRVWGEEVISKGLNIIYEPEASVYHWHGIHQDLNAERVKNVVRILENLNTIDITSKHQDPEDLRILAVIPVKGESRLMNNKPLLKYTIESAKRSKFITDIVVATDSKETAQLSMDMGVDMQCIRPIELSENYIDIFDVVEYTVDWVEQQKRHYDAIVLLTEIYPFRSDDMIDKMISKLVIEGYDTVVAGASESRGVWINDSKQIKLLEGKESPSMPRSLKGSKIIIGLSGLCCVTLSASLRNNIIFSGKVGIFDIIDPFSLIVVRNKEELALASIVDKNLKLTKN